MPRFTAWGFLEPLQVFRFHLFEIPLVFFTSINKTKQDYWPLFILAAGFSGASAPGVNIEIEDIQEGNIRYPRKWPGKVSFDPITLERGVMTYDSDFWRWIVQSATGNIHRKSFALVHYTRLSVRDKVEGVPGLGDMAKLLGIGNALTLPGKIWLLKDCLPGSYKPGSDFDASSSAVSIASLEVFPECVEEYSLAA